MINISKVPSGEEKSDLFNVTVNRMKADVYPARVSAYPYNYGWPGHQRPIEQSEMAAFVSYESDEPAEFTVDPGRKFSEVIVRPISKGVSVRVVYGCAVFTVKEPGQYSLEFDGHHNNLHIFADPLREYEVKPGILHFAPGVHHPGLVRLKSNDTVIIDRGAVVYGSFVAVNAENVKICGCGVIDGSYEKRSSETLLLAVDVETWGPLPSDTEGFYDFADRTKLLHGAVKFYNCHNCSVEGVICRDSSTFTIVAANSYDVHINFVKLVGMWRYNSDGIDLFNCHDFLIENTFLRDFDDCMVLKGIKGWDKQNVYNITMKKLVVWCDWGRALEIGAETCADEYYNILFEDCDCIHAAYSMLDIQNGDRAYVHDVTFCNIRCEYTKYQQQDVLQTDMSVPYDPNTPVTHPRLILIHGYTGQWSKDGIPGKTSDILYKNITYFADEGIGIPMIDISGYSEGHGVSNVTIDGIYYGKIRLDPSELKVMLGHYTDNITIR